MGEYTALTVIALAAVIATELVWLRTGLFRSLQFWVTYAIIAAFQVLVDGWLTRLSAPIVRYNPQQFSGIRFPWDIPIEDFGFGFAMVTVTLLIWRTLGQRHDRRQDR